MKKLFPGSQSSTRNAGFVVKTQQGRPPRERMSTGGNQTRVPRERDGSSGRRQARPGRDRTGR